MNAFTQIQLQKETLDIYLVRTSIFKVIQKRAAQMNGSLLDIGCGKMPYRDFIMSNSKLTSYVGLDIESALQYDARVKPDFFWDGNRMPFEDNSFDCAMATEVLEHCPNPSIVLAEAYRVLRPGGFLFCTVPFLWPLHEVPYDEFRYTPFALKRILDETGFQESEIQALGGWHASMAQMLGLWVKRSPLPKRFKSWAPFFIMPIYKKLLKMDRPPSSFYEGTMVTGLSIMAHKPAAR